MPRLKSNPNSARIGVIVWLVDRANNPTRVMAAAEGGAPSFFSTDADALSFLAALGCVGVTRPAPSLAPDGLSGPALDAFFLSEMINLFEFP